MTHLVSICRPITLVDAPATKSYRTHRAFSRQFRVSRHESVHFSAPDPRKRQAFQRETNRKGVTKWFEFITQTNFSLCWEYETRIYITSVFFVILKYAPKSSSTENEHAQFPRRMPPLERRRERRNFELFGREVQNTYTNGAVHNPTWTILKVELHNIIIDYQSVILQWKDLDS